MSLVWDSAHRFHRRHWTHEHWWWKVTVTVSVEQCDSYVEGGYRDWDPSPHMSATADWQTSAMDWRLRLKVPATWHTAANVATMSCLNMVNSCISINEMQEETGVHSIHKESCVGAFNSVIRANEQSTCYCSTATLPADEQRRQSLHCWQTLRARPIWSDHPYYALFDDIKDIVRGQYVPFSVELHAVVRRYAPTLPTQWYTKTLPIRIA